MLSRKYLSLCAYFWKTFSKIKGKYFSVDRLKRKYFPESFYKDCDSYYRYARANGKKQEVLLTPGTNVILSPFYVGPRHIKGLVARKLLVMHNAIAEKPYSVYNLLVQFKFLR